MKNVGNSKQLNQIRGNSPSLHPPYLVLWERRDLTCLTFLQTRLQNACNIIVQQLGEVASTLLEIHLSKVQS